MIIKQLFIKLHARINHRSVNNEIQHELFSPHFKFLQPNKDDLLFQIFTISVHIIRCSRDQYEIC